MNTIQKNSLIQNPTIALFFASAVIRQNGNGIAITAVKQAKAGLPKKRVPICGHLVPAEVTRVFTTHLQEASKSKRNKIAPASAEPINHDSHCNVVFQPLVAKTKGNNSVLYIDDISYTEIKSMMPEILEAAQTAGINKSAKRSKNKAAA